MKFKALIGLPHRLICRASEIRLDYRQHCKERGCRPHKAWAYRWGVALAVGFVLGAAAYATTDTSVYMFAGRHDLINGFIFGAVGFFTCLALTVFNYTMHKSEHLRLCCATSLDTRHIRSGDEGCPRDAAARQ